MRRPLMVLSLAFAIFSAPAFPPYLTAQEEPPAPRDEPETEIPAPHVREQVLPDFLPEEQVDPVMLLGELRGAVRTSPDRADDRLKLAQVLFQIGDVDAALDECRAALRLAPESAKGHVQLGVILMTKQDWRHAAAALKEAVRLDPELAQAHYNLGTVQYSLGNPKAAVEAYRRALALQSSFPDARYRLALVLQVTAQHQEAARLMEEAAEGGVAQAQFFIGQAYRQGRGVEKDLVKAIAWWTKAAALGEARAAEALSQLRRKALSSDQRDRRAIQAREAFQRYREAIAGDDEDAIRHRADEPLETVLLKESRWIHGLGRLLSEAYALSEPAHERLARLYESGGDYGLVPFDRRILRCLETTATDGFMPAKKTLARIYGKGLGVPRNLHKAKDLLKGLPKQDVKPILDEMATP
ncbi:tetratricopeptide repeat protein [Nitrospira moscoviensis]|nr:tetratricopeptide repeat protein [Nitrospira moscoviensis]